MPAPELIFEVAVILIGLVAWIWIAGRRWRRQDLLPFEPRRLVPWNGVDLLVILAALILLQGICLGIAVKWSGIELPNNWNDLTAQGRFVILTGNLAANVLTLLVAVVILRMQAGAGGRDLGLDTHRFFYDVRCGAVAFAAAAPVVFGLQWLVSLWIPYQHQLVEAVHEKNDMPLTIVAVLSAIVVAPLFEEFFFRVVLQGWLEKKELSLAAPGDNSEEDVIQTVDTQAATPGLFGLTPGMLPIVISSAVFAIMHWGQGGAPVPLFVFALVLGFLYQRTHRIVPSLTVHLLLNAISLTVFFTESKA